MAENKQLQATSGVVLNIRAQLGQMNPAQGRIARYILENPEAVPGMPIGRLAQESNVSEASISRFVKFLGCTNYRAFQAEMVKSNLMHHEQIRGYADVKNIDNASQICEKIINANIQCLTDTFSILDTDEETVYSGTGTLDRHGDQYQTAAVQARYCLLQLF